MKAKIAYVLVADPGNYYLEQTWMSAYTARKHNPDTEVVLVTDRQTLGAFDADYIAPFLQLFHKVIEVETPDRSAAYRSRYLKTTLPESVGADFIYLDSDTIVCDNIEQIEHTDADLALVADMHVPQDEVRRCMGRKWIDHYRADHNIDFYPNGGVIWCRRTPQTTEFFRRWHTNWKDSVESTGRHVDQPPLFRTMEQMPGLAKEMPGEWNCQLQWNFLPFLHNAHILHTIVSSDSTRRYLLNDPHIFSDIRHGGGLTPEILSLLDDPKSAFRVDGEDSYTPFFLFSVTPMGRRMLFFFQHRGFVWKSVDFFSHTMSGLYLLCQKMKAPFKKS